MAFRLLEQRVLNRQREGYFNLYGQWRGPQLVMEDRGEPGRPFPSGVNIEHAAVVLDWGSYSDFKSMCANGANSVPKASSWQRFGPGLRPSDLLFNLRGSSIQGPILGLANLTPTRARSGVRNSAGNLYNLLTASMTQ